MSFVPDAPAPSGWSTAELAALGRMLRGFVDGDPDRMARLGAAALEELAEPFDLWQLKLALRVVDVPVANVLLGAGAVRFRELDEAASDHYLLGWGTSRIPLRRTTFQALKRLALFLAYADPGPGPSPNPLWSTMGYAPTWAPPTPEPSPVRPLAVERSPGPGGPLELDADVVVVGSGAGGGLVAARLAAAGRSVLVVEAGSAWPEAIMPTDELTGFKHMFLDRGLTGTSDLSVAIVAGATLGGGMTVNWTTSIDPPAAVRAMWAGDHGLEGFDGTEADDDLARLRAELAIAPATVLATKDRLLIEGCHALGYEAAPNERNTTGCDACGGCTFGCRAGNKRAGRRGHLGQAAEHGARFLVAAPVDRLMIEGGCAAGVEGRLLDVDVEGMPSGVERPYRVHADQVVIAAGALRTPLVLLRSLAAHRWTGHGLRLHPVPALAGVMPERVDMWAGPLQSARSLEFLAGGPPASDYPGPAHGPFVVESAPPHPGLAGSAFPWTGRLDSARFMAGLGHVAPLISLVADRGSGRVSLSRTGRARIDYRLSPADANTAHRALVEMARIARAAGATSIVAVGTPAAWFGRHGRTGEHAFLAYLEHLAERSFAPNRTGLFSAHQMGTARAGSDAVTSVCDPWGRVRADARGAIVPGLYVSDSSLFPTAIAVNPQLTIMALAERVARTVIAES
ncbi:MAG TPA: GMC family oxidoreductase N-terminal domain-containing protein [Candidatus Limnocylindrales bacterium]